MTRKKSFRIAMGENTIDQYHPSNYSSGVNSARINESRAQEILDHYSRDNHEYYNHKHANKGKRVTRVAVVVLLALMIVLACGVFAAFSFIQSVNSDLGGAYTPEENMAIQEKLVSADVNEPFYVLLVGSDSRSTELSGSRSDTNILVRVDPTRDQITMLSIPRDTKINIPGYGTNKFNAAYAYGGIAGVIDAVKNLTGIEVAHYAEISFEGVVDLVDAMGGVEVDVPVDINDPDAWGSVSAGTQTLDGEHALIFARSRQYADGDFSRTSNQRTLVTALVKKVLNLPVNEIPDTIQRCAKCVTTDMSVFDIYSLAVQFKNLGELTVYSAMVPSYTDYIDGVSYVICDTTTLAKMIKIMEEGGDPNTVENTNGSQIGSSLF